MKWKHFIDRAVKGLMIFSTIILVASLGLILLTVLIKGIPVISWEMISKPPSGGFYLGGEGGILNAIMGSIYLSFGGVLIALIFIVPVILYINNYRKPKSKFANSIRLALDVLWGIPSIVYGAFGFIIMIQLGLKMSLLMGMVTIAFLIIPVIGRSFDEIIRNISTELKMSSYALGATRFQTSFRVVLKQSVPGLLTAVIIALGRAIGDAAAVLYTAGFTDNMPQSLLRPVATLPLTIFFQLSSPYEIVQNRAYASALILTVIILVINILFRALNKRLSKNIIQ